MGDSQTPVVAEDAFTGFDLRPTDSSFFVLNLLRLLQAFVASARDGLSPGEVEVLLRPCDWFGRSIAEGLVRSQLIEALRRQAPLMAQAARQANNAKGSEKSLVQVEAENKLAALLQLKESGVPSLDTSIDSLRDQIAALSAPVVGPDWEGLAELVAGGLDSATDEELRVIFLEFFERISFEGTRKPWASSFAACRAAMRKMAVGRSIRSQGLIALRWSTPGGLLRGSRGVAGNRWGK